MKIKRKIIHIDEKLCNGCGNCVVACAEGAIQIVDGKAKIIKDQYCDGLGACIGDCPQDALKIIEREADEFDEKAVEKYLKELENKNNTEKNRLASEIKSSSILACGCPSTHLQVFTPSPCSCDDINKTIIIKNEGLSSVHQSTSGGNVASHQSALGHWPVQIRLIPPTAPFLKEAELLVTADCVPVAYPAFHQNFLKGKVVMVGCPKFDDVDLYIDKFADIFKVANIKSVTVLIMEVPCCSGLPMIVQKGMALAGGSIPITKVVINARGSIFSEN